MPKKLADLKPGAKKTVVRAIDFRRTIANYDRRLPAVLSTPSMIGQMEVAAARVGQNLRATAVFERIRRPRGKRPRYVFAVEAAVGKKLIGRGRVERAAVPVSFSPTPRQ